MSILVTRPSPAGEELVSRLRTLGQVAWHFPLIEFSPGHHSCISKIVNGPDYLIISPLDAPPHWHYIP